MYTYMYIHTYTSQRRDPNARAVSRAPTDFGAGPARTGPRHKSAVNPIQSRRVFVCMVPPAIE